MMFSIFTRSSIASKTILISRLQKNTPFYWPSAVWVQNLILRLPFQTHHSHKNFLQILHHKFNSDRPTQHLELFFFYLNTPNPSFICSRTALSGRVHIAEPPLDLPRSRIFPPSSRPSGSFFPCSLVS